MARARRQYKGYTDFAGDPLKSIGYPRTRDMQELIEETWICNPRIMDEVVQRTRRTDLKNTLNDDLVKQVHRGLPLRSAAAPCPRA